MFVLFLSFSTDACVKLFQIVSSNTIMMGFSAATFLLLSTFFATTFALDFTACNCSAPESTVLGLLKPPDSNCELKYERPENKEVEYVVVSYRPEKITFPGYKCRRQVHEYIIHHHISKGYQDMFQNARKLLPSVEECVTWAEHILDYKPLSCDKYQMTKSGSNWVTGNVERQRWPSWLLFASEERPFCQIVLEEMSRDCPTCPIHSTAGNFQETLVGNFTSRNVTWLYYRYSTDIFVWKKVEENDTRCLHRILTEGVGQLSQTEQKDVQRLKDSEKQLDFLVTTAPQEGDECFNATFTTHYAVGMKGIHLQIRHTVKEKRETGKQLEMTAHSQYLQDLIIDNENQIIRYMRKEHCRNQQIRYTQIVAAAQYNGWLPASFLNLPTCVRLVPTGTSAFVQKCGYVNVSFHTDTDKCGAKPVWQNFTISTNGWELTKNVPCYWQGNVVTLGRDTLTFTNDDWIKLNGTYEMEPTNEMKNFQYEADKSLDHIFSNDLDSDREVFSHMYAFADLMAIMQNHEDDPSIGRPHMSTVVIDEHEASNQSMLQQLATWLKYFGAVTGLSAGGLLAFRFFGGSTLLWKLFKIITDFSKRITKKRHLTDLDLQEIPLSNPMTVIQIPAAPQRSTFQERTSRTKRSRRGRRNNHGRTLDQHERQSFLV